MLQAENTIKAFGLNHGWEPDVRFVLPIHDELILEVKPRLRNYVAARMKLAMEEIEPILRYDSIRTDVDVEYSDTDWAHKVPLELTPQDMESARKDFDRHKDEIVLDYKIPLVDWFLQ